MKATRLTSIRRAFVLHPDQIRRIVELMEESGKKAKLKVECVGGLSLEPSSIQELLAIANTGDYKIETIKLESWADPVITVDFTLGTESPIKLYVSGDDLEVIKTYEKLWREVSQTCKGKWTFIHDSLSFPGGSIIIGFIVSFVIFFYAFATYITNHFSFLVGMGFYFLIIFLIAIPTSFLIWKTFVTIYPKGIFLIGAGVQEYEAVKNRQQQLSIWSVVAGLIVATVLAIIQHWFHF